MVEGIRGEDVSIVGIGVVEGKGMDKEGVSEGKLVEVPVTYLTRTPWCGRECPGKRKSQCRRIGKDMVEGEVRVTARMLRSWVGRCQGCARASNERKRPRRLLTG